MDIFEKQQTIEVIKVVVKARWFIGLIIFLQGVTVNLFLKSVPLASTPILALLFISVFLINFSYWLYLRRPPEKISDWGLRIVKVLQVLGDQAFVLAILYSSGTANKMLIFYFFITVMAGSFLYKAKGVILSTLSAGFIYTGLVLLEYFGLMPPVPPAVSASSPYRLLKGDLDLVKQQLIFFNWYIFVPAIFAGYLANLFKGREEKLRTQKDELLTKTQVLTRQTQELTQTKDLVQDALIKSDKARVEVVEAKEGLEKANIELRKKIGELEKFYRATVGRELKMVELKKKIKVLEEKTEESKGNKT